MAEKITTIEQLRSLALRGKAYSAAGIANLAELMASGLESVQHTGVTVTLPAANWSSGAQIVRHDIFLADSNYWYIVCGDANCFAECGNAGVRADNITTNGQATFRCETTPASDLTVNILRLEVEA